MANMRNKPVCSYKSNVAHAVNSIGWELVRFLRVCDMYSIQLGVLSS